MLGCRPDSDVSGRAAANSQSELTAQILRAYADGELVTSIAKRLAVSRATIFRLAGKSEQALRRSTPRMDEELRDQACELYRQGQSLKKIEDKLGVPATTVKRALLQRGVRIRGRSERI